MQSYVKKADNKESKQINLSAEADKKPQLKLLFDYLDDNGVRPEKILLGLSNMIYFSKISNYLDWAFVDCRENEKTASGFELLYITLQMIDNQGEKHLISRLLQLLTIKKEDRNKNLYTGIDAVKFIFDELSKSSAHFLHNQFVNEMESLFFDFRESLYYSIVNLEPLIEGLEILERSINQAKTA